MKNRKYKGAGVMLFRFNKTYRRFEVLLGKRAVKRGFGQWAIFGGKMEACDRDYEECAYREFKEETGVDIKGLLTLRLGARHIDIPYYHWRTYMILTWGYFPDFKPNSENSELRWFPASSVCHRDLWISLNGEIRAFNRLVRKHAILIAYHTGMPFEDSNLLEAYRQLTYMKTRNPIYVEGYLNTYMNISPQEARRLSRALRRYYEE